MFSKASDAATDAAHVAALLKVAGAAYERAATLMQDVGLLPRDLGVRRVTDAEKATRLPSGRHAGLVPASMGRGSQ